MFDERRQRFTVALNFLDTVATVALYLLAIWAGSLWSGEGSFVDQISLLPTVVAMLLVFLPYWGAYRGLGTTALSFYVAAICKAVTLSIAALFTLIFFFKIEGVSRFGLGLFVCLEVAGLVALRVLVTSVLRNNRPGAMSRQKVLIVGTGGRAQVLSEALRGKDVLGVDIIGHIDPDQDRVGDDVLGAPVIGTVGQISHVLKQYVVDEVILAIPRTMLEEVENIAYACQEEGVRLRIMADIFTLHVARTSLVELGAIPLLTLEPVALDERKLVVKRSMDFILAVAALLVLFPVFVLVALAIRIDSPGPVLFVQERVGLRKRPFPMVKFRSMRVGSEERIGEMEQLNEADGPAFKIADDPRITRVGRIIRRTSLDELPQLFNVLKGEMSLVGPRPMSLRDVALFEEGAMRKRFSVKPGITGLWQVSGRSNLPFSKWLELDLRYIENWSLGMDLAILLKTVPAVIKGTGAV